MGSLSRVLELGGLSLGVRDALRVVCKRGSIFLMVAIPITPRTFISLACLIQKVGRPFALS